MINCAVQLDLVNETLTSRFNSQRNTGIWQSMYSPEFNYLDNSASRFCSFDDGYTNTPEDQSFPTFRLSKEN